MGEKILSTEKMERIIRSLLEWARTSRPNVERGGFTNPTKKTYHGHSPFIPTKTLLDEAKGLFKKKDNSETK